MKTTEKTFTIHLTDDLNAILTITRGGQNSASENDKVYVCAVLTLPAKDNGTSYPTLEEDIRFEERLCVFGSSLRSYWGDYSSLGQLFRTKKKYFEALTWKQAFTDAEVYSLAEVKKLTDALAKRAQALIDAETE